MPESDSGWAPPDFKDLIIDFLEKTFPSSSSGVRVYWVHMPHPTPAEGYIFIDGHPCGRLTGDMRFVHVHQDEKITYNVHVGDPSFFTQLVDSVWRSLSYPKPKRPPEAEILNQWKSDSSRQP